jgi:hypothetical protein
VEKTFQEIGEMLVVQESGADNKVPGRKNKGPAEGNGRPLKLHPASYAVVLAKFSQCFGAFPAFADTGFFIVLAPFEFAFDAVYLQLLLQLTDRVLDIASDFNLDHKNHILYAGVDGGSPSLKIEN